MELSLSLTIARVAGLEGRKLSVLVVHSLPCNAGHEHLYLLTCIFTSHLTSYFLWTDFFLASTSRLQPGYSNPYGPGPSGCANRWYRGGIMVLVQC